MATDYKALGKRISNARKQAGITQEALGEQLNMTRKHISVIESAIKRPSLDALVDIANLRPEFQLYSPHINATAVLRLPESETG